MQYVFKRSGWYEFTFSIDIFSCPVAPIWMMTMMVMEGREGPVMQPMDMSKNGHLSSAPERRCANTLCKMWRATPIPLRKNAMKDIV